MEDDEITHWLELPAGMGFVPFSELAHLIAKARFPVAPQDEEYDFAYGCARVNLDEELPKAVAAGLLKVRDPLTHGPHTFPHGFALQSAVVKVSDLRAFLADRGIGVRVMESGNGPTHWTIGNAAAAIAAQEGWHGHARDTLKMQMMEGARNGTLTVRHPHTALPYRPDPVRDFYETVTPADVNAWLALDPAGSLRWLQATPEPEPALETVPAVADDAPLPLTTGDIAFCFDGLRWSETEWKKPLGDKRKWLQACIAIPGRRGLSETRWNPVLIGGALVSAGHVPARSVRARFQTRPLLAPWLDAWRTYEADQIESA